jgi:hypothetical protein
MARFWHVKTLMKIVVLEKKSISAARKLLQAS